MFEQTIVMGDRKRIGSLFGFRKNRARNRMAIRTQIRTREDGPLATASRGEPDSGSGHCSPAVCHGLHHNDRRRSPRVFKMLSTSAQWINNNNNCGSTVLFEENQARR
jgi:hypothetical protein